eukprot:403360390
MNLEIIDFILKKAEFLIIDADTYNIIPIRRRDIYKNVKKLQIGCPKDYQGEIQQLLVQFPNLESLEVKWIFMFSKSFFTSFEYYFKSSSSQHLKNFKTCFIGISHDQDIKTRIGLSYLFKVIVDIEVPKVQLTPLFMIFFPITKLKKIIKLSEEIKVPIANSAKC